MKVVSTWVTTQHGHNSPALAPELAEGGYLLTPNTSRIQQFKQAGTALTRNAPQLVGRIPNAKEFGEGDDIYGSMYVIKYAGSDKVMLPARDKPFLATVQDMIDREYALGKAHDLVFALRPSRHTAEAGEAHQRHIPGWHRHPDWGKHRVQTAANRLATQFVRDGKVIAGTNNSVVMFDQDTEHRTPTATVATRRTFLAFMALDDDVATRKFRGGEYVNPAERLLMRQPYQSYDQKVLEQHWLERGAQIVAQQQAKRPTRHVPPHFIPVAQA